MIEIATEIDFVYTMFTGQKIYYIMSITIKHNGRQKKQ